MKQYIMGMLTGASLMLCAVMFIGASSDYKVGKYQIASRKDNTLLLNTASGQVYEDTFRGKAGGYRMVFIYIKYTLITIFKPRKWCF